MSNGAADMGGGKLPLALEDIDELLEHAKYVDVWTKERVDAERESRPDVEYPFCPMAGG